MIQVVVFWVVMPCSVMVGYQCYGESYCFHLQGEVNGTGKRVTCACTCTCTQTWSVRVQQWTGSRKVKSGSQWY